MKERILVVPNSNKLSLSLAYQDKYLFNTRVFTSVELAREALLRSGKVCNKEFISRNDELSYYKELIDSVSYFKTSKLADIKNVNQTINTIRKLVVKDETTEIKNNLSKGPFKEKNDALYEIYEKYINKLNSENKVDTIGLIRYAIDNANVIDAEFITLNEYPLQPLEEVLINKVSNNVTRKSIFDLFEVEENGIHIESYKNCYGSSNEVATIINDIFANKDKEMDQCVVACADYPTYSQIFNDYACKNDIAITFGNGISIVNSYPGKLLQQYHYWSSEGNFGWEPFFKLIYSPYFNYDLLNSLVHIENPEKYDDQKFWDRLSRLRLTNDSVINKQRIEDFKKSISRADLNDNDKLEKFVPSFEVIASEFALPVEEFLDKYFTTRSSNEFVIKLDETAKKTIINEIKSIKNMGLDITSDVIEILLRKPTYRQSNKPGHIHITTIDDALSSLRNNLYVCGLSSTVYPGSPKENPLLLDDDLKAFNNSELTSSGKILNKRESLLNLVKLASALNNKIVLSYPGLNVSELKNNNASSLMFEIYKSDKGEDKGLDDFKEDVVSIGYFEPKLSKTNEIGDKYNGANEIIFNALKSTNDQKSSIHLNRYSPSALKDFFECRKKFFYQYLIGIPNPNKYNPYEIIPANEEGTLAHSLMEYLADHRELSLDEFKELAANAFDEYLKITVPLVLEKAESAREEFVTWLENGYRMDEANPRKVDFKEEDKTTLHDESGITIHGFPDRVEETSDGKAVIIDFKTGRDEHIEDDVDTCLQVLIYAYIVEKECHKQIDHCEYRMLRKENGIIKCKYDQEIKDKLTEKLLIFKNALDTGDFSIEPMTKQEERSKCTYCMFGDICGKVVTEDDE